MPTEDKLKRYNELFPDDQSKAAAFEQIAKRFYAGNFGTMSKSDFETLLFHLYIERILAEDDTDYKAYSDFRLAKELGISQSKVSNLKVKKQMQYPYEFDWKKSFVKVSKNVRYESGKFKIQIPDINLYHEIKNAIEESGGYIDVTLTPRLLQISPSYFLDLLVLVSEKNDRKEIKKMLQKVCVENGAEDVSFEEKPFGQRLKNMPLDVIRNALKNISVSDVKSVVSIAGNALAALLGV